MCFFQNFYQSAEKSFKDARWALTEAGAKPEEKVPFNAAIRIMKEFRRALLANRSDPCGLDIPEI